MEKQNKTQAETRPPIVVVMGHIDHGKSMILETIRNTKMLEKEAGGITQHIGAYEVEHKGRKITFIDTPGHEVFSKMRSRGAKIADLAVLVVAADEGVKPQTKEAIEIIRQSKLPFAVALNKIDKPEANPQRVKQELAREEVLVEGYGGKIPAVEVSAKTGENLDGLLEVILLMADLEELRFDPGKPAQGVVIEALLDPRRGNTATLLPREGILRKSHTLVIGRAIEGIKIMENFLGRPIDTAFASSPVRITGIKSLPKVGEEFRAFEDKTGALNFIAALPPETLAPPKTLPEGKLYLNVILKTDVRGSEETLAELLQNLETEELGIRILSSGVGDIGESDVKLAIAFPNIIIIGFKVRLDPAIKETVRANNILVITGEVIYELMEETKRQAAELLPLEVKRTQLGIVRILKVFKRDGSSQIAGGRVESGLAQKGARTEIRRMKEIIGGGIIRELQREKAAVDTAEKGAECGLLIDSKTAIQEGDVLEIYQEEVIKRGL